MVYPDGVWYAQVRADDVPEIVEEHIVNGRPVKRLALLKVPRR
jgi:(2Fe-2S) ferredoxin